MTIKILVNGANGRMGKTACTAIRNNKKFLLVASTTRGDNLAQAIKESSADVVIDLTLPDCIYENVKTIIAANVHPVIGASGLSITQIDELKIICEQKKLGGIIAPNFSIGAMLVTKLAGDIARFMPEAEIIEMHHEKKLDAPSATAIRAAAVIAAHRKQKNSAVASSDSSRGKLINDVPIHAVRLPGLLAHIQILFGASGETLTLRHDSLDRQSFMAGMLLACEKVMGLQHLVYGLEEILLR